ncbi:MAG: hypothetical protein N4A74_19370 [Carboxylicivirga sp.]|nr:hypothetical protein [Carboxylicivirga sp.]
MKRSLLGNKISIIRMSWSFKLIFFFVFISGLALLTSCEKDDIEAAGDIPGMGDADGELLVKEPFVAPEGFAIEGINGVGEVSTTRAEFVPGKGYMQSVESATSTRWGDYNSYGCGGRFIKIKLSITNSKPYGRCLWLPRGLVFEVSHPDYQNGILACWLPLWVQGNSTRTVIIEVFCINEGKSGSDISVTYKIKGVTKSRLMMQMLNRFGWRMINKEFYYGQTGGVSQLKSMSGSDLQRYVKITEVLQEAIWSVTNRDGKLTEEQIDFIESIPLMPEGSYPSELEEEGYIPPEDWNEYGVEIAN